MSISDEISFSVGRVKAVEKLSEVEVEAGVPMAFFAGEFGVPEYEEYRDAWVFNWNCIKYIRTGEFSDQILMGPIAVPKDGSAAFFLGTARTVDQELELWRRVRDRR